MEPNLIDIYRHNKFLTNVNGTEYWFSIDDPIDDSLFKIPFAIITAWNPSNTNLSMEENRVRNHQLEETIKGLKYAYEPSVGKYEDHAEESFIVYRISRREAIQLGIDFGQYSIFYNSSSTLAYIECLSNAILLKRNIRNRDIEAYVPEYFSIDENSSLTDVINLMQKNHYICPNPQQWSSLWRRLGNNTVVKPLILGAWYDSTKVQKQACFFEQLRYAETHNMLRSIIRLMNTFEKSEWLQESHQNQA